MNRILVVGADETVPQGLLEAMRAGGLSVERVTDAMSAVAALDRNRPDVVLARAELPDWRGLQLLRHVGENHPDVPTFLLVDGQGDNLLRAQRSDVTPLLAQGEQWNDVVEVIQDRVFERTVDNHRDRRQHLALGTATVLLDALDSLKRASNYRKSSDLLRETAIVSTREVVEESVCSTLTDVPGYSIVWVSRYAEESDELLPKVAGGVDIETLSRVPLSAYRDDGISLQGGTVAARRSDGHAEVVVPLERDEEIYGAIHVQTSDEAFSAFERDQLSDLGRIVSRFITALGKLEDLAAVGNGDEADTARMNEVTADSKEGATKDSDIGAISQDAATSQGEDQPNEAPGPMEQETPEAEEEGWETADAGDSGDRSDTNGDSATESADGAEPAETMSPLMAYSDTIAHELRNHINVAEAFLDLGRSQGTSENFDRVEDALERIERLTDEAAAVASERIDPDVMTKGDLSKAVEVAWGRVDADEATMALEADCTLEADLDLLELLLENLFRNAVDHVGRDVEIRVGRLEDRAGFYVEDDGPGIPRSDWERLFEWGVSGGDSDGGVGLAIVKRIVDNHGWEISITNGRDGGARFEIGNVRILD